MINKTLQRARNEGKTEGTIKTFRNSLQQLSLRADILTPTSVKQAIANATNTKAKRQISNSTKRKWNLAYTWFCETNNIQNWTPTKYKTTEIIPIIPTRLKVETIISNASKTYATIFKILAETAAEPQELYKTNRHMISLEQRAITITGTKGHGTANYKLKPQTTEMLTEFLAKRQQEYPFPKPRRMTQRWIEIRKKVSAKLNDPELNNIPLRSLRNYSAAQLYLSLPTRDVIRVMRHLRHKKMETTMHYIRGIVLDDEDEQEYDTIAVQTKEEAIPALNKGYTYTNTTPDGWMLYRKRK